MYCVVHETSHREQNMTWPPPFQVTDSNDNAPVFLSPTYSFDVSERSSPRSPIGRVAAVDADASSSLSYNLLSEWGSDRFSLDPFTGVLSLSALGVDFEETPYYVLLVSASDGGSPALTATTTVYVNVRNENDNAPRLESAVVSGSVRENRAGGPDDPILTIKATDQDQGQFATIP